MSYYCIQWVKKTSKVFFKGTSGKWPLCHLGRLPTLSSFCSLAWNLWKGVLPSFPLIMLYVVTVVYRLFLFYLVWQTELPPIGLLPVCPQWPRGRTWELEAPFDFPGLQYRAHPTEPSLPPPWVYIHKGLWLEARVIRGQTLSILIWGIALLTPDH